MRHPGRIGPIRPIGLMCLTGIVMAASATADNAADEAAWAQLKLTAARPLVRETALVRDGAAEAVIVPADGSPWSGAAARLQDAVAARTGVTLPIVAAGDVTEQDWRTRHLVVLGNLLVNPVFARLYHNYFACADAAYTGTAGYELRTVHDPWGTGRNAIVLGAQDAAGLAKGADRLIALIDQQGRAGQLVLGRLLELKLDPAGRRVPPDPPLDEQDEASQRARLDAYYDRPGTERGAAHLAARFALDYHRSGDERWLALYRHAMQRQLHYYATDSYIVEAGPRRYDRDFRDSWAYAMVIAWDLVEEHPSWTEAERLELTNHVLRVVWESTLYQRWDNPEAVQHWRSFASITHNHHTWPGLACLFGGWYFQRHYRLPVADDWLTIALGMFSSCSRSWKPWEDSAGYQWIPMRHILTYALAAGDPTFIDQGHAAEAGQAALMAIDTLGHEPAWGDHAAWTGISRIPGLLSCLEYVTGDGRYRWALEHLGHDGRGELQEPYWTAVAPAAPDDLTGVAASYVPKLHYDLLGTNPDFFQAANLPFAETFDKLTFRSGWSPGDDYLMLDGHAAGSHGHLDANAVIGYTARGTHWLVDGEYIRRIPKYHNAVTVLRDGVGAVMPPSARLDGAAWFGGGGLSRTTLTAYNGVSWTRNLILVAGGAVTVIDELTAETAGRYALRCCWRVSGEVRLTGDTLQSRQLGAGFTLRNLSGDSLELVPVVNSGGKLVHQLYQRRSVDLAVGQTVRFVNVFAAGDDGPPELEASLSGPGRVTVRRDGRAAVSGVGQLDEAGFATDAAVWRVADGEAWLLDAAKAVVGGQDRLAGRRGACRIAAAVVEGQAAPVPATGQRPVYRVGPAAGSEPALERVAEALARTALAPTAATAAAGGRSPGLWRYADFAVAGRPLPVVAITAEPEPLEKYRPVERLVDRQFSGSTGSCMFPAGRPVTITLDLGSRLAVREVRVRAWEMNDGWKATNYRLALSDDGFQADTRPVAGEFAEVGTQRWGGNVNTIRGLAVPGSTARWVRLTADPAAAANTVYVAELEVYGSGETDAARFTALAAGDLDGDGRAETVVGTAAGQLVALTPEGRKRWSLTADGPLTALAVGPVGPGGRGGVVYATETATLGVLDGDGRELGKVTPPAYRGIPSRVRTIRIADLDGDGTAEIVAGADSWMYFAYTPALKLRWKSIYYAHGATVGEVADLDGDGKLEVIAGNAYYCLALIETDGKTMARGGRFGPEQTAVAAVDLNGDGAAEAIVGTDDGTVVAFTGRGEQVWTVNAGDRITSLVPDLVDGRPVVVVASDSGWLWCLDAAGQPLWRRDLGEPVKRLAKTGAGYLAAASAAGVLAVDRAGGVTGTVRTPGPALDLVVAGDRAAVALGDGSVVGVPAP